MSAFGKILRINYFYRVLELLVYETKSDTMEYVDCCREQLNGTGAHCHGGKEWNIRAGHYIYFSDIRMWIDGDTIVDGMACKKLYTHTKQLWEEGKESVEVGYCRQDGDKYYQNGDLMFDFSLGVGDEFATYVDNEESGLFYAVVGVGDTVWIDGLVRKYMVVAPCHEGVVIPGYTDIWVEGIGSLTQGIAQNDFYWSGGVITELQSCSYNGQCIYAKSDTYINNVSSNVSTPYYDFMGRPVANPTRGIYIKDGKKIAVD